MTDNVSQAITHFLELTGHLKIFDLRRDHQGIFYYFEFHPGQANFLYFHRSNLFLIFITGS